MRERAIVIEEHGDQAKIQIIRSSACAHCRGCSIGSLDKKKIHIWAKNPLKAKPGQTVEVELTETAFFQATILVYLIPLIAFILGLILGYRLTNPLKVTQEIFALIIGLSFMSFSFVLNYLMNSKFEKSGRFVSKIVNILT